MQKSIWQIVFFTALLANLTGIQLQLDIIEYLSKPLLLLSLIAWFISSTNDSKSKLKNIIYTALCLSLAGDMWLLYQKNNTSFFIYGLVCFLAAHIFYILAFNTIRKESATGINWWSSIFVAAFYFTLIYILLNHLGNMKIPVLVYGAVISAMLFAAVQLLFIKNQGYLFIVTGAVLFILSDSILAINKFYSSFNNASLLIMITYGFAQYFIVKGMIQYLDKENKLLAKGL